MRKHLLTAVLIASTAVFSTAAMAEDYVLVRLAPGAVVDGVSYGSVSALAPAGTWIGKFVLYDQRTGEPISNGQGAQIALDSNCVQSFTVVGLDLMTTGPIVAPTPGQDRAINVQIRVPGYLLSQQPLLIQTTP